MKSNTVSTLLLSQKIRRDLQGLLSNATNNINQIAKRVNSTGIIYKEDISGIKKEIEQFSKELWQIHSILLNRTSGDD